MFLLKYLIQYDILDFIKEIERFLVLVILIMKENTNNFTYSPIDGRGFPNVIRTVELAIYFFHYTTDWVWFL